MRYLTILLAFLAGAAYAQTEPLQVNVRACTGTPTSDLMSGCPTSQTVWADPQPETLVVILRSGAITTSWSRFDTLAGTDRVSACLKSDTPTGAFQSCPTRVTGTTNWLARSLVATSSAQPPPSTLKRIKLIWIPPTTNADGSPLTNLKGYTLSWRQNDCAFIEGCTAPEQWSEIFVAAGVSEYLDTFSGNRCYTLQAVNSENSTSIVSDMVCTNKLPVRTPNPPTGITVTWAAAESVP